MKTKQSRLHSRVLVEGIAVSIHTAGAEFLVRYRDGKQRLSRTFERLDQAQAFARFLARRQHWLAAAQELGAGQRTPVMPWFLVGPATVITEAVEQFLSACAQMDTSVPTLRTMAGLLRSSLPAAPTVEALTLDWSCQATAPPGSTAPHRAVRRAVVGRFLGWLARQPIEVPAKPTAPTHDPRRLTVAQAESLLRACPDLETQRWVAMSLFAGLRPREVEALRWEKVHEAIAVADAKTHGLHHAPVNLRAWLQVPKPARGPVVSQAAGRKAKALLVKLNIPVAALRTTCVLCWLALHGGDLAAGQAGVPKAFESGATHSLVSRAEAEGFFGLTPD